MSDSYYWLEEHERRLATGGGTIEGKVVEVDTRRQMARVEWANEDGESARTPWIPWSNAASNDQVRVHLPVKEGEWVSMSVPGGDIANAMISGRGWSKSGEKNHDQQAEYRFTIGGGTELFMSKGEIRLVAANIKINGDVSFNGGGREVVYKGSNDTGGFVNIEGEPRVKV